MNWETLAACAGEWDLFDRTDPEGIAEMIGLCRACPVINECMQLANETRNRTGVWAGRYFSAKSLQRGERAIFDGELCDATEDELKAFHRAYYRGERDPFTMAGERAYSRSRYHARDKKNETEEAA